MDTEVVIDGRTWAVGARIGGGGFGQVYEAESAGDRGALKFVPKAPGAERELLFVDLAGVPNVVPILGSAETTSHWVLLMPRAEMSLRQHLDDDGPLALSDAVEVLLDIATALVSLDALGVVHRDLKPHNVLRLNGTWCLADFGISRYAEATTAPDTQKYAMSPPYAAPERWRAERATASTDVYAFGVMAFEMLSGELPFQGPGIDDFRQQHLHEDAPSLDAVGAAFGALVDECLYKAPGARPSPTNLLARLNKVALPPTSSGLAALQAANRSEVLRRAEVARAESVARTAREEREALAATASRALQQIGDEVRQAILDAAPAAQAGPASRGGWSLGLHLATLTMTGMRPVERRMSAYGSDSVIDVIGSASIELDTGGGDYRGRSHSLWYCDAVEAGRFQWFEVAFMEIALGGMRYGTPPVAPHALEPSQQAAEALSTVINANQLAWPFTPLVPGDLEEFIERWAQWFALAAERRLQYPSHMPERATAGSFRTT